MSKQATRNNSKKNRSQNKQSPAGRTTNGTARPPVPGQTPNKSNGTARPSVPGRTPNKSMSRQALKQNQQRAARTKRVALIGIISAVILVSAVTIFFYMNGHAQNQGVINQPLPTEQIVNPAYQPVDNIYCSQNEQLAYHHHVHLSVYVDGKQVPVAQGVGIAPGNSCLYWLHTHSTDGILHIEAPVEHTFTLGNFLHIWGNQFSKLNYPSQLDITNGWLVYVNGKVYHGDFNAIPLNAHSLITLAYNSPHVTPDTTYNWGSL